MSLCIIAGGKTVTLAVAAFTLSWTHSVERTRWEEDWRVRPIGLEVVAARVQGSGAGMEPPGDAVLENGWWTYRPRLPPRAEIVLAASGATDSGWTLCAEGGCVELGRAAGDVIRLKACNPESGSPWQRPPGQEIKRQ